MKKIQRNGGSIYEVHGWIWIIYEFSAFIAESGIGSTVISAIIQCVLRMPVHTFAVSACIYLPCLPKILCKFEKVTVYPAIRRHSDLLSS